MKRHQPQASKPGFTLAEVLVAVAIFVIAIFAILKMVSQSMELVRSIQLQRPDLGTLAGKTMMDPPQTGGGGDAVNGLASGLSTPDDEDFGGNNGGSIALYPDAKWERYLDPIDETNGGIIKIERVGHEGVVFLILLIINHTAQGVFNGLEHNTLALHLLGCIRADFCRLQD